MRSFLALLMVLAVSAGIKVIGFAGDSVLLPCNCSGRNQDKEFKWQMESNGTTVIVINKTNTDDRYKGRAERVVNDTENPSNCSLVLMKINTKDSGNYTCIFSIGEEYSPLLIELAMSADPSPLGQFNNGQPNCDMRYFKIIPIVLLLGICLV